MSNTGQSGMIIHMVDGAVKQAKHYAVAETECRKVQVGVMEDQTVAIEIVSTLPENNCERVLQHLYLTHTTAAMLAGCLCVLANADSIAEETATVHFFTDMSSESQQTAPN